MSGLGCTGEGGGWGLVSSIEMLKREGGTGWAARGRAREPDQNEIEENFKKCQGPSVATSL